MRRRGGSMKIILTVVLCLITTGALATPTLKNCGKSTVDQYCSNAGCRIDMDTSTPITNCEVDFDTAAPIPSTVMCTANYPQIMTVVDNTGGNSVNFLPTPGQVTSLSGLHVYFVCGVNIYKGR